MSRTKRLSFISEWYQEEAALVRTFLLFYFVHDNAIEVYDRRTNRIFLRRTEMPDLTSRDFFVGSKINVFGRTFDIIGYADEVTKSNLAKYRKMTFVLLKYALWSKRFGDVLTALIESNFNLKSAMMAEFTPKLVKEFLNEENNTTEDAHAQTTVLMEELLCGPAIGIAVDGDDIVNIINQCLKQKIEPKTKGMPNAFYILCNDPDIRNGIYCAPTDEEVTSNLKFFFSDRNNVLKDCQYRNSTLGIIKPHAIKERKIGHIIEEINKNNFRITAMRMVLIARYHCEEFYEVYRSILPEYIPMVTQLASGVCMCMEIVCNDETKNSHKEFRDFCGPMDTKIAQLLRPKTLRAKFGIDKVSNGIHCTDLPEDTNLELQYIFKILDLPLN